MNTRRRYESGCGSLCSDEAERVNSMYVETLLALNCAAQKAED